MANATTPSSHVKPEAPSVWVLARNQQRRWERFMRVPVRGCRCGHSSLAHVNNDGPCEGLTDEGLDCTCQERRS